MLLQSIINGLHANGQRFVPIVEPVVYILPGYQVHDTGVKQNVFMKDVLGNNYVGQVCGPRSYSSRQSSSSCGRQS